VISFLKLWILLSALLSAAGWTLSALGQLNGLGYSVFLMLVAVVIYAGRRSVAMRELFARAASFHWRRGKFRFRRPLPLIFLVLAVLAFLGGLLHAPNNYDALTYRVPRVLHWLQEGTWHWVHSQNARLNTRVCGIEWLSAPLLLATRTDRFIFLINWFSFLLLPGLVFSLFTRLGVRARVAWHWMWLVPAGFSFVLQAGSISNDTFAAVYAMAAIDFALRARASGRSSDAWLSVVAAALLTGSKLSNLPLLLPWVIALYPSIRLLGRRRAVGTVLFGLAVLASCLPTICLNLGHGANWSGASLEDSRFVIKNPLLGIAGNGLILVHQNFAPPFFPWAPAWNELMPRLLPEAFRAALVKNFEPTFLKLGELPNEEAAGLGLGVLGLLVASVVGAWRGRSPGLRKDFGERRQLRWLRNSFVVALLAFMSQSGLSSAARIISPYYPFLLAACLASPGHAEVIRRRWWQRLAMLAGSLSVAVVILTPSRPLWAAQTILSALHERTPQSRLWERALSVYSVYASRSDGLAPVRQLLPADATVVGWISSGDDPETSLLRPFGGRRILHVLAGDDIEALRQRGVVYYVIGSEGLTEIHRQSIDDWVRAHPAQLLGKVAVTVKVAQGPRDWYVARLVPPVR
jgi:hypothetical protein